MPLPGYAWWCALLAALQVFSLVSHRRLLTLGLLLVAFRSLRVATAIPPHPHPDALFQGPLWWCMLLVGSEAAGLVLREWRGPPAPSAGLVLATSTWLGLLAGLTCMVNW